MDERCSSDGNGGVVIDFDSLTMLLVKSQLSWVTVGGAALYIWVAFLVLVVLMWLRPKIIIFGVSCLYTTDTTYYWYKLYFAFGCLYNRHHILLVSAVLRQPIPILSPYK
jgi:hypothetical protein